MKILQVLPALESGGVERGTLEIAQALTRAGHEAWVLSAGGRLVDPLEACGARHVTWDIGHKNPRTLGQIRPLRRWLAAQNFDIVHARSRLPAWILWLAWRKLPPEQRPHFMTTMHGLHSVSRYSAIMTRGERVIAVSRTCRQYILDNYPQTPPERIRLIYRGIDPAAFPWQYQPEEAWLSRWYEEHPGLRGGFVITMPGRLTRLKGHIQWLEMMAALRQQIPDLRGLVVGGEDPKRQRYAREVYERTRELGLGDVVTFAGHRSDIREIYAVSNVVMSLSAKPESFGRTVLEPLSMGTPVVGFAHGGVAEILEALFPEGAVPVNDLAAAKSAVARIAAGQTSAVRPNRQFLLENMQSQTLDVYRELMAETSTPNAPLRCNEAQ